MQTTQEDACLMRHAIRLNEDAFRDLEEIHDYIAEHGAPAKAGHVLDRHGEVIESLSLFQERGSYPKELLGADSLVGNS